MKLLRGAAGIALGVLVIAWIVIPPLQYISARHARERRPLEY